MRPLALGLRTTHLRRRVGGAIAVALALTSALASSPADAASLNVRFSLTRISFGAVTVSTSVTGHSVVTNRSSAPLHFISAIPSGGAGSPFTAGAGTCTGALAPGASCALSVVFAPTLPGLQAGTLAARFGVQNASGHVIAAATMNAALVGRGVLPTFTLAGASAGQVMVGDTGVLQPIITNTSNVPLSVNADALKGVVKNDFKITSVACPAQLLPGQACGIQATFTPWRTGSASATLTVSMVVSGTTGPLVSRQATLSGEGVAVTANHPPFALSPLSFGRVTVGTTATGYVVLTNLSKHNETLSKVAMGSNPSGAFASTGEDCPTPIPAGASCELTVTFSPASTSAVGARIVAQVTFLNAKLVAVSSSKQAALVGKGVRPTFTLAADRLPLTTVGTTSEGLVVVTNTSLVPLGFAGSALTGGAPGVWSQVATACLGDLAPATSCAIDVRFTPRAAGTSAATEAVDLALTVRGHATVIEHRVAMVGHSVLPTFRLTVPALPTTPTGVAVSVTATIANTSTVSLTFHGYQFSGTNAADFSITASICGAPLGPGTSCTLTVRFWPSAPAGSTEHSALKVLMTVPGTTPAATVTKSVSLNGHVAT